MLNFIGNNMDDDRNPTGEKRMTCLKKKAASHLLLWSGSHCGLNLRMLLGDNAARNFFFCIFILHLHHTSGEREFHYLFF